MRPFLISLLLLLGSATLAFAQEDTIPASAQVLVETKDGSQYYGQLIKQDRDEVILRTESVGDLEIPIKNISNIQFVGNQPYEDRRERRTGASFTNPNPYRYLFFPSAFTLERGELMYQNTYLSLNSLGVGIANNFSVSGGLELISSIAGSPVVYIAPKVGVPVSDNFRLGLGGFYANSIGYLSFGGFGAAYAMGTIGTPDRNTTIGFGYASVVEEGVQAPLITLSGMLRTGRRLGLVTENWILPGQEGATLLSLGLRIMGEKIAGDIAFFSSPSLVSGGFILPYLSLAVKL